MSEAIKTNEIEDNANAEKELLFEKLIKLNRVAKVVKGGRRFSFSALTVVGNRKGSVGIGFGKANDVSDTIRKSMANAKKNMKKVVLNSQNTLLYDIKYKFKATKIFLKPATPGTGIIAGMPIRSIMEAAGINNVLTKIIGSRNPYNVTRATIKALDTMLDRKTVARLRGKSIDEIWGN